MLRLALVLEKSFLGNGLNVSQEYSLGSLIENLESLEVKSWICIVY